MAADAPDHPPTSAAPLDAATFRLERQLAFLVEIDKLKGIVRRNYLVHGDRRENTAEHSWHLALAALVLAEHAEAPAGGALDLGRVVRMLLVHDLVEIDAGDTFCYDPVAALDKDEREQRAADRLFALLPADQERELRALWEEFEERRTPEARFAGAVDRLMPVLHNYHTGGRGWRENRVDAGQVLARNQPIEEGSAALWARVRAAIDDAVARGLLAPARSER